MAAGDGLISMTPTSIAYSGTSASINADGGVDFSAVTSLSLNGVFTGDYDNYLVVMRVVAVSVDYGYGFRLRAAGTDNNTASSYVTQSLDANGASRSGSRITNDEANIANAATGGSGTHFHFYGPALTQPTAIRSVNMSAYLGAFMKDYAMTHNQSVSYDGFSFFGANAITGNVHVFGYEE